MRMQGSGGFVVVNSFSLNMGIIPLFDAAGSPEIKGMSMAGGTNASATTWDWTWINCIRWTTGLD